MEITTMTWSPAYAALPARPLLTSIVFTGVAEGGALSMDVRPANARHFFDADQGLSTWGPPV